MLIERFAAELCRLQGNLFANSAKMGFSSENFCKTFMKSEVAASLDKAYNHLQWAGESYVAGRFMEECGEQLKKGGTTYYDEALYWIGYTYRYWHYYTGEDSKTIVKIAPPSFMAKVYYAYHTMDCAKAIDRIKEARL